MHRLRVFSSGRLEYLKIRCNREEVIRHRDLNAAQANLEDQKKQIDQKRKTAIKGLKGADKKMAEEPLCPGFEKQLIAPLRNASQNSKVSEAKFPTIYGRNLDYGRGMAVHGRRPGQSTPGSLFDERLIIMSINGKRLHLTSTLKLTEAIRGALLSACSRTDSGMDFRTSAGRDPVARSAYCVHPPSFRGAGDDRADGRIMGAALALPE